MTSFSLPSDIMLLWQSFIVWWMPIDKSIEEFIYFYPLFMAYIWMFGAIIFCIRFEWRHPSKISTFPLEK
jgi:biofilm PGA synthesis N-glycosyltransferase PgaC